MTGLVAILSSLVLLAGGCLSWFQPTSTVEAPVFQLESLAAMILGTLSVFVSLYHLIRRKPGTGWVYLVIGVLVLVLATLNFTGTDSEIESTILGWTGNAAYPAQITIGSFLLQLAGGTGLVIAGLIERRQSNAFEYAQSPVAGFIATRVAFNRRDTDGQGAKSFSRFIIRLSTVATVISVMVMIVTLSFANGFQEKVSEKVFSFLGHIRIQEKQPEKAIISEETPIRRNDALAREIKQQPGVTAIYPYVTKYGLLKTKDDIEGVLLKGLDSTYDFNRMHEFMKEGRTIHFNDTSYSSEIMISTYTANQLQLKLNDRVLIYFIKAGANEDAPGDLPNIRARKLTIVGIYKTGIEEYDKTFAIADMKMIQRLNADGDAVRTGAYLNEIGGYEIFIRDYKKTADVAEQLYNLPDFPATWNTVEARSISPNIFDWLNMQDTTRNVLMAFMISVAVINLITCLIILVLERVRMIGILKALGATDWTVQKIFLRHSAWITVIGIVAGTALALGILWLQQATGFIRLKEEAYYISAAAVKIVWWQVGLVCICTFLVCFLVMMIPSVLVRKIQPVRAIQFR